MPKNIQSVSDSLQCSACGACSTICAKNAIEFNWSSMGRKHAHVTDDCVDCGLCVKVCPSLDEMKLDAQYADPYVGDIRKVYVGRSTNSDIFTNAQSGGMCTTVLSYLFDSGKIDAAVVTCMTPGITPIVEAKIVTSKEELNTSQKSCYTPVSVLTALKQTDKYQSVAVVGLPCHIHGLTALMKTSRKYQNITYKLGLICDRTLCATVQESMLSLAKIKNQEVKIEWRKKNTGYNGTKYPYQNAPVVISTVDKQVVIPNAYRFALKDFFTPPRCRRCTDKINIHADIVFGDPWRMPDYDRENGDSVVIVRSDLGERLISECIENNLCNLFLRPNEQVVVGQLIDKRRNTDLEEVERKDRLFIEREHKSKAQIVREAVKVATTRDRMSYKIKMKIKSIIYKIKSYI